MMSKLMKFVISFCVLVFISPTFAGVQPNGSFSHSIEIKIPPGTAGMQPKLALVYNSNGDNGILGQGWHLSGIPVITRIQNGKGINYLDQDTFAVTNLGVKPDSNSKLYTSGAPDYFKEIADYVHYRANCLAWYSVSCEPESWVARDPSGLRLEFGTTTDSRVADGPNGGYRVFALNKVTDLNGNSYTISYDKTTAGEIYPEIITYAVAPGIAAQHTVHFLYESRADSAVDHMGASAYRTVYLSKRLKWVEVRTNGMLVRKYKMFYGHTGTTGALVEANTYAPSTGRSRLTAVQEFGSDGASMLPAQTFDYAQGGELEQQSSTASSFNWLAEFGYNPYPRIQIADFDGDGRADIIAQGSDRHWGNIRVSLSTGQTFQPFFTPVNYQNYGWAEFVTGDFNGDGKADIFGCINNEGPDHFIAFSTGRGFASHTKLRFLTENFGCNIAFPNSFQLGDFDGDGRTDIFQLQFYSENGQQYARYQVWMWHRNEFETIVFRSENFSSSNFYPFIETWKSVLIGDINGDGKSDLLIPDSETLELDVGLSTGNDINITEYTGIYEVKNLLRSNFDFNGDGRSDIMVSTRNCQATFWPGATIFPSQRASVSTTHCDRQNVRLLDYNGDGVINLLNEFTTVDEDEYFIKHFADMDGDGKIDIINTPITRGSDPNVAAQITRSSSPTADLLTLINNGNSGVTTITYKPAPQVPGAVDPSQSAYPIIANSSPRNLVTQVTTSDGRGASYATQYQYHNGKVRTGTLDQRKDLGFEWIREINAQTGAYTQTWYNQVDPNLAFAVMKTESFAAGGIPGPNAAADYSRLMSRISQSYEVMLTVFNESHVIRPTSKISQTYEYGNLIHTSTQTMIYDDFADMMRTSPVFVVDAASGTETVVSEFQYATPDWLNWRLNRLTYTATRKTSITGPILNQTQFIYDSTCGNAHNMCKRNDWLNAPVAKWITTTFAYDTYGNVTDITDTLGHNSHIEYDAVYHAQPVTVRNALNQEVTSTFDPRYGALLMQTDPNGGTTEQILDVFGRPIESRVNGQTTQTIHYNDNLTGNANQQFIETRVTDASAPGGYTFARNYFDGLGRTYKKESSGPNLGGTFYTLVTETQFDWVGRKQLETHPYLYPRDTPVYTEYEYDGVGRVSAIYHPEGTATYVGYYFDASYRTYSEIIDPMGNSKVTATDARGRQVIVNEGGVSEVRNQYDALGQLTQVTDADGHITTIQYDSLGRKIAMIEPNTGLWTYAYDDAGNLTVQTDPKGQAIGFQYDTLNRLTDKLYPVGGGTNVHYTYDDNTVNGIGRLTQINDAAGVMKYSYDTRGNVTAWRQTVAGKTYSFQAAYDIQNRPQRLTYPDGEFVENYYAESGYLKQVRLKNPDKVWGAPVVTYYGPETTGNPNVLQLTRIAGNNVTTKIGFDRRTMKAVSLVTKLANAAQTVVEDVTFAPDSVGNITQVVDNLNANKSQTFQYDSLYRLTQATSVAYGTLNYSYSPGGNLLSKEGTTLTYGNAAHPQAVTQAGANSYTYDANANMVTRNGRDLVYDAEDRLTQVALAGVAKQTYTYDHSGQRVVKAREDGTTVISLSGLYEVMRLPDNSERHTKYIFGIAGEMVSQITRDGASITLTQQQIYTENLLALSSFHGSSSIQGPFLNAYFAMDYFFANPRATRITLLVLFIGVCLALFIVILRSRLRGEENPYARANPKMAAFAPLVLFFAVFEFGLLGCSASSTAGENATPWSDLPAAPPGSPDDIANQNYGDTSTAGFPVLGAYFMHPNHVGSPSIITNAAGTQVLTTMMHKPYGEIVRNPAYSSGADITRYKFTGQEEDAESGLVYMNARFYDPAIGRFISSDSEFGGQGTQGFNRHMYATGNPIKYTDPSGHNGESQEDRYDMSKADEKGNVPERARGDGAGEKFEKGNRGEQGGSEARAESRAENSSREHVDMDKPDRGDRGATGASNARDNSQINAMIAQSVGGSPTNASSSLSDFVQYLKDVFGNNGGEINVMTEIVGVGYGGMSQPGQQVFHQAGKQTGKNVMIGTAFALGLALGAYAFVKAGFGGPAFATANQWANSMASVLSRSNQVMHGPVFRFNGAWKNAGAYMQKRGWTPQMIVDTLRTHAIPHPGNNFLNPGNPMLRYVNPGTGQSLILDAVTRELIMLGGKGFKF